MPRLPIWARRFSNTFYQTLFELITRKHLSAFVTRFALAFLNVWQAFVMYNHNYWIPQLVAPDTNIRYFVIYSIALAVLSVFTVFHPSLWIAALVLAINSTQYLYLSVAALFFSDPPRASAGLTLFVAIVCVAGFWRVIISLITQYRRPKRT